MKQRHLTDIDADAIAAECNQFLHQFQLGNVSLFLASSVYWLRFTTPLPPWPQVDPSTLSSPPPPLPDPLHRIQLDGSKHTGDLSSIPSISNIQLELKLNLILAPIRLKTGHLNATGATGIRNPESV